MAYTCTYIHIYIYMYISLNTNKQKYHISIYIIYIYVWYKYHNRDHIRLRIMVVFGWGHVYSWFVKSMANLCAWTLEDGEELFRPSFLEHSVAWLIAGSVACWILLAVIVSYNIQLCTYIHVSECIYAHCGFGGLVFLFFIHRFTRIKDILLSTTYHTSTFYVWVVDVDSYSREDCTAV